MARISSNPFDIAITEPESTLIGWAAVSGLGVATTTGGGDRSPTVVRTLNELQNAVAGSAPAVVRLDGVVEGNIRIGSNKTIEGAPGARFTGSITLDGSRNVIMRRLTIVGYNCSDNSDCSEGHDAITVMRGSHHLWFDHCDISDGSDGNLDITLASDFITVSWTRFSYSSRRPGGHLYSNLVGANTSHTGDAGHLKITWHHNWWAENITKRMPLVRYGKIHVFNSLFTCEGNTTGVGVGHAANVLLEKNIFINVHDPVFTRWASSTAVAKSNGNLYVNTTGNHQDYGSGVFTPPYPYTLEEITGLEARIRAGAGP